MLVATPVKMNGHTMLYKRTHTQSQFPITMHYVPEPVNISAALYIETLAIVDKHCIMMTQIIMYMLHSLVTPDSRSVHKHLLVWNITVVQP